MPRGLGALALAVLIGAAGIAAPVWSQPEAGQAAPSPPPVPSPPPPPVVEAPDPPERGAVPEEALERIDRALEEVEESIEEGAEAAEDEADSVVLRERRERIRDLRGRVHERLRQRSDRSDNKVAFGSSIHIEEGEVASDVVAIGGRIEIDGDVVGDVVAVGGPISIDGQVTGDVVAVGGGVELGEDAEVLGEVTSVGGRVERAPGAEVSGRINEVAFGAWDPARIVLGRDRDRRGQWWDWDDHDWSPLDGWFGFVLSLTGVVVLLLLSLLVRLVAGSTVERVRAKAMESPWLCGLVGLAIELFFVPVMVVVFAILLISLIGIPLILLLPFVVLALLLALIVGYTAMAQTVGEWAGGRFGRALVSPYAAVALGVLLLHVFSVIGDFFDIFGGLLFFFAIMFGVVGFLLRYVAWTLGLGAVFLTAVRRSSPGLMLATPPPPPPGPVPEVPYPGGPASPAADPGWSGQPMGDRYGDQT